MKKAPARKANEEASSPYEVASKDVNSPLNTNEAVTKFIGQLQVVMVQV